MAVERAPLFQTHVDNLLVVSPGGECQQREKATQSDRNQIWKTYNWRKIFEALKQKTVLGLLPVQSVSPHYVRIKILSGGASCQN